MRDLRDRFLGTLREGLQSTAAETRANLVSGLLAGEEDVRGAFDALFLAAFRAGRLPAGMRALQKEGGAHVRDVGEQLEALLGGGYLDPVALASSIPKLLRQTCQICVLGDPIGTGFLIGRRQVLTACHVVRSRRGGAELVQPSDLAVRFDVVRVSKERISEGRRFEVASVCAHRFPLPSDSPEIETPRDDPALDYAVLELREDVGGDRGWVDLRKAVGIQEGAPLILAQHPQRGPLRFAVSNRTNSVEGDARRLCHHAPTEGGSSGAACLSFVDEELAPVALHQGGRADTNYAIRMVRIREDLQQRGVLTNDDPDAHRPAPADTVPRILEWLASDTASTKARLARLVMTLPSALLQDAPAGEDAPTFLGALDRSDRRALWQSFQVASAIPDHLESGEESPRARARRWTPWLLAVPALVAGVCWALWVTRSTEGPAPGMYDCRANERRLVDCQIEPLDRDAVRIRFSASARPDVVNRLVGTLTRRDARGRNCWTTNLEREFSAGSEPPVKTPGGTLSFCNREGKWTGTWTDATALDFTMVSSPR
jgi:Trypsin-like peptidase domain